MTTHVELVEDAVVADVGDLTAVLKGQSVTQAIHQHRHPGVVVRQVFVGERHCRHPVLHTHTRMHACNDTHTVN